MPKFIRFYPASSTPAQGWYSPETRAASGDGFQHIPQPGMDFAGLFRNFVPGFHVCGFLVKDEGYAGDGTDVGRVLFACGFSFVPPSLRAEIAAGRIKYLFGECPEGCEFGTPDQWGAEWGQDAPGITQVFIPAHLLSHS